MGLCKLSEFFQSKTSRLHGQLETKCFWVGLQHARGFCTSSKSATLCLLPSTRVCFGILAHRELSCETCICHGEDVWNASTLCSHERRGPFLCSRPTPVCAYLDCMSQ
eukprot:3295012-Amphidinium_carterae.1